MNAIYKCEDFSTEVHEGVLTIWGAELIGMAKGVDDFGRVYDLYVKKMGILPNGIICPALYCEQRGINLVIFEK
jgi:hypothetical protein